MILVGPYPADDYGSNLGAPANAPFEVQRGIGGAGAGRGAGALDSWERERRGLRRPAVDFSNRASAA